MIAFGSFRSSIFEIKPITLRKNVIYDMVRGIYTSDLDSCCRLFLAKYM